MGGLDQKTALALRDRQAATENAASGIKVAGLLSLPLQRRDWTIAALLFAITVVLRLPFRSRLLYHWDSALFALAFDRFDVAQHFPQPPGYIYYVYFAKLIDNLAHDRNLSLLIEGMFFSGLAVGALYLIGRTVFDRRTGLAAAVLLMSSVSFWSYGEIAFPYVILAFFSTAVAFLASRSPLFVGKRQETKVALPYLTSLAYALAGGFRQDLILFLAPLWLLSLWGTSWRKVFWSLLIVAIGGLAWFWPTTQLSGGLTEYLRALSAQSAAVERDYGIGGQGPIALVINVRDVLRYAFYALYLQVVLVPVVLIWAVRRWRVGGLSALRHGSAYLFLAWALPPLLFYSFVHVGDPGYVFSVLPAVYLLIALAFWPVLDAAVANLALPRRPGEPKAESGIWRSLGKPGAIGGLVLALLFVGNSAVFLFHSRILTAPGIRQHDAVLQQTIDYVRTNYPAGSTILLAGDSYRHLQYYLPDYKEYWVDPRAPFSTAVPLASGVNRVLIADEYLAAFIKDNADWQRQVLPAGVALYSLDGKEGQAVTFGQGRIAVQR